jgi:zinc protease
MYKKPVQTLGLALCVLTMQQNVYAQTHKNLDNNVVSQTKSNQNSSFQLSDKIPQSPQLKKASLPNGLTYYIQKNVKPENLVELRLVLKAGSILEDQDQLGLAHFTEHMAFNGSRHFKKNELVSFLESIGVKFGADLNASTGFDQTIYMIPVPTNRPENLEKSFMVLADWAGGLSFDAAEIDKERGVVLEESRLRKGAAGRISKITLPKILAGSRYADRLPIGTDESIQNFKHDALKRFYRDWYRPDLMAVVVVGDVEPRHAEALVKKYFSKLKNPKKARALIEPIIPPISKTESLVVTDKEATTSTISIMQNRTLQKDDATYGAYRQNLVQSFFNRMMSSRLSELSQVANPPFLGASISYGELVGDYEQLTSAVAIGKAGAQPALDALMQEKNRAFEFGFTATELERIKQNSLKNMEVSFKERDKQNSNRIADEFIRNFTSNESLPSLENEFFFHKELVSGIRLEEINQFAKKVLMPTQKQLVIYQGPEVAEHATPKQEQLLSMIEHAEQVKVSAYVEKKIDTQFMEQIPASGKIVAETRNEKLDTTELVLSNGVKVILKKTDFKNDQILFMANRLGGSSLIADADVDNARMSTAIVNSMGLRKWTPIELRKMLSGKTASNSVIFGDHVEGFSGSAAQSDFELALQILSLSMQAPRRDPELFQSAINKSKDAIKNMMAAPEAVFSKAVLDATFASHPRKPKFPTAEALDALNLDRIIALYQERFSSAKGYTFFIVGSFDLANIKPLLATYLGSLPVADVQLGLKDHGLRPIAGQVQKEVFVGKEQKSLLSLKIHGEAVYSHQASMRMRAMIDVLQFRLTETLREQLGAVYSPRVSGSLSRMPYSSFSVDMSLPCAPENVDKLRASTLALMEKMKSGLSSEADLNKVKENWLKNHRERLKSNNFWLNYLNNAALYGDDPSTLLNYEQEVNALTIQQIQEAAQQYLNTKNMIQVVMYPEKK